MDLNKFDTVASLTTEKVVWSIRVRAQTIWKGINRTTNEFRGFNIIFMDEQNCRIHAFITEKLCPAFSKELKEGNIYILSNFKVHDYKGDEPNRAVRNQKHIYFDNQTNFKRITEDVPLMKEYAFDLFGLNDVPKFLNDNRFLIDVIGTVSKNEAISVISTEDTSKSHLKFKLEDGRNMVMVTFFNEFGQSFEKALKAIEAENVVVVIASAKVNKYEEIYLTNYPATRFYLTPRHYSGELLHKSAKCLQAEEETDTTLYTIKEIKNFTKDYIEKNVLCHVTVKKVEEECNWYDNFHIECDKEVNIIDGRYHCCHCKRNLPYPDKRFRICTVCTDKTGVLPIILPDEEIQRLTGKDVYELENENREAGDEKRFPPILKEFENKQYLITLMPSKDNIEKKCSVYKAKMLSDTVEMLGSHNPLEQLTTEFEEVTENTEADSTKNFLSYSSPPTSKSTTRTRGRKTKAPVKYEVEDCEPISKLKKS
ncbi:hypothetical protein POM88_025306 [Heracleum sosnowskyi]|uniref:Replication factor A C-terminal domain-containing protein n=1 Tax=Heracleum sosnowskyi TaxID=360622 RepID=A0AAD8I3R9_9APIA|nr:hypothetical protein POM88_025306 [Heracleum sosnowskyi]